MMGRGGAGQVVSELAFYSNDRVRIPLTPTVFSVKMTNVFAYGRKQRKCAA